MIAIVTDSTCDVSEELLEKHGIIVVPNTVIWGNTPYRDRVDLKPEEFYHRLSVEHEHPTTSTPSLDDFQQAYKKAIARGAEAIIVLTVSSAMSGVYQLAVNSSRLEKIPVRVIDSKGPTMSLGWQVLAAARARDAGAAMPEIIAAVEKVRGNLIQLVYMDTLEYLKRGGRIGNAVKWVGVMLQVKPLVSINHLTGLVEPVWLARTHASGVEVMYNKFVEFMQSKVNLHVAVLHGNVLKEAEVLAARIKDQLNPSELLINITGPVLGINTGPGALALCGYAEGLV
jgi:DegV family protein with EDD domain